MLVIIFAIVSTVLLLYVTVKAWRVNQHWTNKGIPHQTPSLFLGNLTDVVFNRRTIGEIVGSLYDAFPDEPVIGYYHGLVPQLIIRDRSLSERILIKDFPHFVDHNPPLNLHHNALGINLFTLTGDMWRAVRSRVTSIFSPSKMRLMFPRMNTVADRLLESIENDDKSQIDVIAKAQNYTMDVAALCVFGMDFKTILGNNEEFRRTMVTAFGTSPYTLFRILFTITFPNLARWLKLSFFRRDTENYLSTFMKSALKERENSKTTGNDFLQLMLNMRNKGSLDLIKRFDDDESGTDHVKEASFAVSDDFILGQTFSFMLIGFDTTVIGLLMTCLDMSMYPKCQAKARDEVRRVVDKYGSITYENMNDLEYVERCLKESLRLHSSVQVLFRTCYKRYPIPGTSLILEKGDRVILPITSVHLDPKNHPKPTIYQPDRWLSNDEMTNVTFLPFGEGPRICIAVRFAYMQMKLFLAKVLLNYKISLHPSVKNPLKISPRAFFATPSENLLFTFDKICEMNETNE